MGIDHNDLRFGIHENGDPVLTVAESNEIQMLDVARFTQVLGSADHKLNAQTTTDARHQFEGLLSRLIVTPHGDPAEEWQEFQRHKESQQKILAELFRNPEGKASITLFATHIAPLFGDGTKRVRMPVEHFERRLADYFDSFFQVPNDIVHLTAEHNNPVPFHEALALVSSGERLLEINKDTRHLTGEVLASFVSQETGALLPKQKVVIDVQITPEEFAFAMHGH